jgi:hypothetical protein
MPHHFFRKLFSRALPFRPSADALGGVVRAANSRFLALLGMTILGLMRTDEMAYKYRDPSLGVA